MTATNVPDWMIGASVAFFFWAVFAAFCIGVARTRRHKRLIVSASRAITNAPTKPTIVEIERMERLMALYERVEGHRRDNGPGRN